MTTITDSQAPEAAAPSAAGRVARVTGAVVDIEFPRARSRRSTTP